MGVPHLVKIGLFGQVGRLVSANGREYLRNDDVICRTERGLEVGSIMCADAESRVSANSEVHESDGLVLRRVSRDDRMIIQRIDRFRDRAYQACDQLLKDRGFNATLVDVEHLFDGQSLFFYFLGEVSDAVHELTDELAETYEKKVRFRKFAETLASGCGPDCGTGESKCSTGGCSSCAVSSSCKSKVVNG